MKQKHSPNFIENEREAYESTNNRATTFFWTVVTVALFLLGFSLTSCTTDTHKNCINKNDLFIELTEKQYKSTEDFIKCLKRHDMDSLKYYSIEQSIYNKLQKELIK